MEVSSKLIDRKIFIKSDRNNNLSCHDEKACCEIQSGEHSPLNRPRLQFFRRRNVEESLPTNDLMRREKEGHLGYL